MRFWLTDGPDVVDRHGLTDRNAQTDTLVLAVFLNSAVLCGVQLMNGTFEFPAVVDGEWLFVVADVAFCSLRQSYRARWIKSPVRPMAKAHRATRTNADHIGLVRMRFEGILLEKGTAFWLTAQWPDLLEMANNAGGFSLRYRHIARASAQRPSLPIPGAGFSVSPMAAFPQFACPSTRALPGLASRFVRLRAKRSTVR